ncbi:P-loop containing nucleoside triphosphate hydrolase protein [Cercophora newfieldiana]|uniref:RNA helicase n=1 Tax=Cercophora newfieldiana TaxID=92897 RepID=A0AA39XWK5_9PEZI|nr:P-loop containing nucleoside triphosphate hydrolase protein [Cercophora newfieldiana]
MSAGTKRSRGDGEDHGSRGKKPKTAKNGDGDAKDATAVKKPKKEEKYKRQKAEREAKREAKALKEGVKPKEKVEPVEQQAEHQVDEPAQVPEVEIPDAPEADADSAPVSDKSEKKEKKDKKKKDKKSKKEKKPEQEAKQPEVPEVVMEDTPEATAAETEPEPEPASEETRKKDKKEKKDKKDKKEKKEKKSKKSKSSEETTPDSGAGQNGESNGDAVAPTNGTVQRNGSTYSYKQTAALDAVAESEIQDFLKKAEINISEPSASNLRPITHFSQIPSSKLMSKKPFASFTTPTPIQSASWPYALSGRDVIGIAETGSGKTLAFSVPCVEALSSVKKSKHSGYSTHARAVIVSPTRELAMQTHAAISGLASLVGLSAVCLYGGASKDEQRALLRKNSGADIIVATPGRLKDFLSDETVSLSEVMFAVLDEADRMLDKGFEDDIKLILGSCPPREKRQTLMFTATWPTSVRGLAEGYMVDPVKVTIGSRTRAGEDGEGNGSTELQANSRIAQTVEVVDPRGKEQRLLELLREAQKGTAKNDRILVFCLYKKEAVRVENFLERRGIRVCSIHGDLGQDQRTRSLEAFKAGTTSVLVATDVAARGLDIPEVKLVINVTFPLTIEDYVHRIGRTGRAGKQGKAITLFTEHDKAHSGSLVNILKGANQPVPEDLLKFGTTVKKKAHAEYGTFFKDVDMSKKGTKITFD